MSNGRMKIAWIFILLLLFIRVGFIPLSFLQIEQKSMSLFYEGPTSTAPVVISFSGTVDEYSAETGWLSFLRGVYRGYTSISGSLTLKIGDHYEETETATIKVSWYEGRVTGIEGYKCTAAATFQVPATTVVSYMNVTEPDGETGTLEYMASYQIGAHSGSATGICFISIVGSVSEYLPEASPPEEAEDQEPEDPGENMDLQENEVSEGSGGSKIYTYQRGIGIIGQISLPVIVLLIVVVIAIALKKR